MIKNYRHYTNTIDSIEVKPNTFYQGYRMVKNDKDNDTYFVSNETDRVWMVTIVRPFNFDAIDKFGNRQNFTVNDIIVGKLVKMF